MSYEMYKDFKETMIKTLKNKTATFAPAAQPTDLESIELNHAKTQTGIDNLQASAIKIPSELPPRITQHRVIFNSESPFALYVVSFLFISCMILSSALYFATRSNYERIDNNLKYRYIKIKGEATLERIAELKELFKLNHNNAKIRQMKKDV
ncbi:hypothetical protein [Rikenella microfusus]|uniref:Uncharacterized protein n=1 Tax=Rikenella microfusus TaxID=28139 RepID=A0A379MT58_9BACT|nr:hypothetical protein [Rikenella microfusus]SUE34017.1 Uncharacterised protein [Rikenella microfusus]